MLPRFFLKTGVHDEEPHPKRLRLAEHVGSRPEEDIQLKIDKKSCFSEASNLLKQNQTTQAHNTGNKTLNYGRTTRKTTSATNRKMTSKTKQLRIVCWNIRTFNNKEQEIIQELNDHHIDIYAISETRKRGKRNTRYENYILIYSGKNKHKGATSRVGLFLHGKYKNNIENIEYHNDKLLTWDLKKDCSTSYRYTPQISKNPTLK